MLRRTRMMGVAAFLAMTPIVAATAATSGDVSPANHDVRCLIATSLLATGNDEAAKSSGLLASMYFTGKIFGSEPDIDLNAAMKRETAALDDAAIPPLLAECGAEMKARGLQVQAAGKSVAQDAVPHN